MAYSEFPKSPLISEAMKVRRESVSISQRRSYTDLILSDVYPKWVELIKQKGTITDKGNLGIVSWQDREVQAMVGTDQEPITTRAILSKGRLLLSRYEFIILKVDSLPKYLEMGYWRGWRASIYDEGNSILVKGQIMARYPSEDEAAAYAMLLADFRNALSSDSRQSSTKL